MHRLMEEELSSLRELERTLRPFLDSLPPALRRGFWRLSPKDADDLGKLAKSMTLSLIDRVDSLDALFASLAQYMIDRPEDELLLLRGGRILECYKSLRTSLCHTLSRCEPFLGKLPPKDMAAGELLASMEALEREIKSFSLLLSQELASISI